MGFCVGIVPSLKIQPERPHNDFSLPSLRVFSSFLWNSFSKIQRGGSTPNNHEVREQQYSGLEVEWFLVPLKTVEEICVVLWFPG